MPPCSPAPCLAITAPPSPIPPSCPLWPAAATIFDHVRTQIPDGLTWPAVASFIAYLIVGVTQMAAGIALPVALAILVVLFLLATRLFGKKIA